MSFARPAFGDPLAPSPAQCRAGHHLLAFHNRLLNQDLAEQIRRREQSELFMRDSELIVQRLLLEGSGSAISVLSVISTSSSPELPCHARRFSLSSTCY
jgi:hypothetical protein